MAIQSRKELVHDFDGRREYVKYMVKNQPAKKWGTQEPETILRVQL